VTELCLNDNSGREKLRLKFSWKARYEAGYRRDGGVARKDGALTSIRLSACQTHAVLFFRIGIVQKLMSRVHNCHVD